MPSEPNPAPAQSTVDLGLREGQQGEAQPEQERPAPVAPIQMIKVLRTLVEKSPLSKNRALLYSHVRRCDGGRIINRLVSQGLVSVNRDTRAHLLSITCEGRRALNVWDQVEALL